ncbi:MAG: hypothetical protein ACK6DP_12315 [Gemmatimonas sp.]|jgi:hypothetical protein|uniref:hypothetical protein n=1 Tax=Gemmatimonas sp. TaxID=1962908 RepID=UPI00391F0630|nr:hypothetical protein [Gemmatimonadota bacterium]
MPSVPFRPKSTLAVDRSRAASRPLGDALAEAAAKPDVVSGVARARGYSPDARGQVRKVPLPDRAPARSPGVVTRAPASAPAAVPAPRASVRPTESREQRDSLLVTSAVVAFLFVASAFGSLQVSENKRITRSRNALGGTLDTVHQRQTEFRIINQRFATWPELKARGVSLPPWQRVVRSNATASHWFISVRDGDTGMLCSRTGELFDEGPLERTPTCAPALR